MALFFCCLIGTSCADFRALEPSDLSTSSLEENERLQEFSIPTIHPADRTRLIMGGRTWVPLGYYPSIDTFSGIEGLDKNFYRTFLGALSEYRLNYTRQVVSMGQPRINALIPYRQSGGGRAAGGDPRVNLSEFDDAFFSRWKEIVQFAFERKIVLQLAIFDGWHTQEELEEDAQDPKRNWGRSYDFFYEGNNSNGVRGKLLNDFWSVQHPIFGYRKRFITRLLQEIGSYPNIIWEVANESYGERAHDIALADFISQEEMRLGMARHLVIPRDLPEHRALSSLLKKGNESGDTVTNIHNKVREHLQKQQEVVIVNRDGDLVWNEIGDPKFRSQTVWAAFMAGGHHNFFHLLSWQRFSENSATDAMKYIGQLAKFLKIFDVDVATMVNRNDLVTDGAWLLMHPVKKQYIVYKRGGGSFNISGISADAKAYWFNPRTGEHQSTKIASPLQCPNSEDWVLYLGPNISPVSEAEKIPPPTSANEPVDLGQVKMLHYDVRQWKETSRVTSVRVTDSRLYFEHTKVGQWPETDPLNDPDTPIEANIWVVANFEGQWYAATWDWMRPGQTDKGVDAIELGRSTKAPPLTRWIPKKGELVGFFVSTPMRFTTPWTNVHERSNVFWLRWPY